MKTNEIVDVINKICAEVLQIEVKEIDKETNFYEQEGMDSLKLMEVIVRIQRHFRVKIDPHLARNFTTPISIAKTISPMIGEIAG